MKIDKLGWFAGPLVGAAAMYFFDPVRGVYRRRTARDRGLHFARESARFFHIATLDLFNRSKGIIAERRSKLAHSLIDDDILVARAAAKLGRLVRYPHPVELSATGGVLIIRGSVFEDEIDAIRTVYRRMPGVRALRDNLRVRPISEIAPDAVKKTGQPLDIFQHHWSPATKLLLGVGTALGSAAAAAAKLKKAA